MTRVKHHARTLLVGLALVAVGGVAGTIASSLAAPAPAEAHPCLTEECGSFLIFWERCEDNPGESTFCHKSKGGCETAACSYR